MGWLKLSWCSLIRIILSQIGGNPLQQMYTSLMGGLPTMAPASGLIPSQLTAVKQLVDQVTQAVRDATAYAEGFSNEMDALANQLYQNPMGTIATETIAAIDTRIESIDQDIADIDAGTYSGTSTKAELEATKESLEATRAALVTFKSNTDRLSGVAEQTGGASGSCSLQDLLGTGCSPNDSVPDLDLKDLVESLKQGDLIAAIKEKIVNASGLADLQQELAVFETTISGFNASFAAKISTAQIKNAVKAQLSNIVFQLLSGCGNEILDLTLKPDIKQKVGAWVTFIQEAQEQGDILDAEGNVYIEPNNTTSNVVVSSVTVDINEDKD